MENPKKKIVILGGGMASLSAAYELTDYENWQEKYEITLYQTGWRLGGKTATGRSQNDRIEEHGIHILQGWYETTFRLLRSVYDERKKNNLAPDSPCRICSKTVWLLITPPCSQNLSRNWVNGPTGR